MATLKKDPTLKDLQKFIEEFCQEKGWDKNTHLDKFLLFSEECGELARAIRDYQGLYSKKNITKDKSNLEEELVDVLNYLLDLANHFDIDLEEAFVKKNNINKNRSWD